jgi:hypothetical protein
MHYHFIFTQWGGEERMPRLRMRTDQALMLVMGFVLTFGLMAVAIGAMGVFADAASNNWPVTDGVITSSEVEVWGHHPIMYRPSITYQYTIGGQEFTCSQVSSGATFYSGNGLEQASEIVEKYPVGSIVQVHYNPRNPANAVLETQTEQINYIPLIIGVVMVSIALIGFISVVRKWPNH